MGLFDDYEIEARFAADFPFGVPCPVWTSNQGDIRVADMTDEHIKNCMRVVGEDDAWYAYFEKELARRKQEKGMIEEKGLGSTRKLLVERYSEFLDILKREGDNVVSANVETRDSVEYFRIILRR